MRKAPKYSVATESLCVRKNDANRPLQDFLAAKFGLSRRGAKAVIDGRNVWVNRQCVWIAHHPVRTGDVVEIPKGVVTAARAQSGTAAAEKKPAEARRHVRVLVETESYVVCDKPAGVLTNEGPHSVELILREQLNQPNLQAVHRLDRDTTGCLLFAKNYAAYLAAVEVFKTHKVRKGYHAIVAGKFPYAHQKIETPLDGKPAVSHVVRDVVSADASLLKVNIETGRTNQIRRHLASVRFPIVGDRTFGLKSARDPRLMTVARQMLHAAQLTLPDPMTPHAEIKAHAPMPADFRACLKTFGLGKR